jgi:hypothetical protein
MLRPSVKIGNARNLGIWRTSIQADNVCLSLKPANHFGHHAPWMESFLRAILISGLHPSWDLQADDWPMRALHRLQVITTFHIIHFSLFDIFLLTHFSFSSFKSFRFPTLPSQCDQSCINHLTSLSITQAWT